MMSATALGAASKQQLFCTRLYPGISACHREALAPRNISHRQVSLRTVASVVHERQHVLQHDQQQENGSSCRNQQGAEEAGTRPVKAPAMFRFRHFTLLHGGPCAMKMGTDAMLLGAWAQPPPHTAAILDVGTGSGVLALIMAQKTQQQAATIHALDIDPASVTQATANAAASPWSPRLHIHHSSLQAWAETNSHNGHHTRYDVIISNPPYFVRSSKPGQAHRAAARHADVTLPFSQLAGCAAGLLAPGGRLCVVLPVQEAELFVAEAAAAGLLLTRLTQVYMKSSDKQPKRHLMQFEAAAADGTTAAAAAAATPTGGVTAAAAGAAGDEAASQPAAATATAPAAAVPCAVDQLVVLVPNGDAARSNSSSSDTDSNGSTPDSSSSSSSGSSSSAGSAAPWVFSQQYRKLTVDFHHPDLLP